VAKNKRALRVVVSFLPSLTRLLTCVRVYYFLVVVLVTGRLRSFGEIARLMGLTEQQSKCQVNSSIRKLRRVRDVLQPYLGEF
jgi:hypothetical protein